jgi:lipopolysaccharide export system ATP-binding protein
MAILQAHGLVKFYGRRKVVDGVSFDVDVGEVVGLLGSNGAGKTTSFRMATGQIAPNEGRVIFNGQDVTHLPMYKRARLGMGYLAQETSVFRKLSVEQNILAVLELQPFYRSLKRRLTSAERASKCTEVLEKFGLTHLRKNNAARLSGGEKRRLEIARCLVCDPLLILLDEPFTGIDPQTIEDIQHIVRDLRNQGIGILVTDHRVREVLTITDRSYLIKAGKVRTHGTPQQIIRDPIAVNEYLGTSFTSDPFGMGQQTLGSIAPAPPPAMMAPPPVTAPPVEVAPEQAIHQLVEQEKVHRLIDRLRTPDQAVAMSELVERGQSAVPFLLETLERRDVEIRRQAFEVLRRILGPEIVFDPYAPEMQRRQQLAILREHYLRQAG